MFSSLSARRFGRRLAALCLLATAAHGACAQTQNAGLTLTGQVTDQATGQPLPYASVGVVGRPVGTVADEHGRFQLPVPSQYDADSLRIALVGYRPFTARVGSFRQRACPAETGCPVALAAAPQTALREVVVRPGKRVRRVLGNSSNSKAISGGFGENQNKLGYQVGQKIRVKYPSLLEQVSFHINECTYDSLFYRVNVYTLEHGQPTRNLLPEPVYVRVRKGHIDERIVADLRRYNLWLDDDVVVALELVKDLGPGHLWLTCTLLGGPLYALENVGGPWESFGAVGVGIDATVTEVR